MRQGMGTGPVGPSSWLVLFEGLDRINKFSWSTRVFSDWYFSVSVAEVRKPCRLSRKRGHHGLRCSYKALNSLAASVLQLCCLNSDSPNEWNVPSHIHLTSLCDMNDKMRTRQGTHVQPHQYLWAWGKLDTAYLQSEFHIGKNIASQLSWRTKRRQGRKRKAEVPIK